MASGCLGSAILGGRGTTKKTGGVGRGVTNSEKVAEQKLGGGPQ